MLKIVLYIIGGIILGWLIYRVIYLRKKKRQYQDAFSKTFIDSEINKPKLKTSYSYAYPSFEITFQNEEQLKLAEKKGLTKEFESKIQKIHKNIKDFEIDRVVYFTWEGRPIVTT
ncbi:MAG: hypothetical protein R3342_00015 [Lutibacter sp.]|uniref:hypothetical protein n=1 Tax=Lutibacter sp. TaxID=1925666 RepID=UPI00299EFDC0|nr:hypothetical protein [Lutibacter sp.]MDX1827905.1 hypothetical protein [Lutibacter sp.]